MLSLFDRLWHKDITEDEAVRLMELGIEEVCAFLTATGMPALGCRRALLLASPFCLPHWLSPLLGKQVQKRLVIAQPSHIIKVVDKSGIRTVKTVVTSSQTPPPTQQGPPTEVVMVS